MFCSCATDSIRAVRRHLGSRRWSQLLEEWRLRCSEKSSSRYVCSKRRCSDRHGRDLMRDSKGLFIPTHLDAATRPQVFKELSAIAFADFGEGRVCISQNAPLDSTMCYHPSCINRYVLPASQLSATQGCRSLVAAMVEEQRKQRAWHEQAGAFRVSAPRVTGHFSGRRPHNLSGKLCSSSNCLRIDLKTYSHMHLSLL